MKCSLPCQLCSHCRVEFTYAVQPVIRGKSPTYHQHTDRRCLKPTCTCENPDPSIVNIVFTPIAANNSYATVNCSSSRRCQACLKGMSGVAKLLAHWQIRWLQICIQCKVSVAKDRRLSCIRQVPFVHVKWVRTESCKQKHEAIHNECHSAVRV